LAIGDARNVRAITRQRRGTAGSVICVRAARCRRRWARRLL